MTHTFDVMVVGGGAAGFFTAINLAQQKPDCSIVILERGKEVLTKVKVSGGGRCNVTHAEFDPTELSRNYPRGEKELLGPFHHFMTGDTIAWFEDQGVALKVEDDGRMFPKTDSSQTIIDCFLRLMEKHQIQLYTQQPLRQLQTTEDGWLVETTQDQFKAKSVVLATGSNPKVWKLLEALGHQIIEPVPSLFTFNITDERITELPGVSTYAEVNVLSDEGKIVLESDGPLLITHWGMSGPAILKLSAWGARMLHPTGYHFSILVNWLPGMDTDTLNHHWQAHRQQLGTQQLHTRAPFDLPKRLWQQLLAAAGITKGISWAEVTKAQLEQLNSQLLQGRFQVDGKSTFKEEFVTAGGIDLREVNFKTFESKLHKNLYFSGEILNIDAITGGFNFQNAWTGGYLVAQALASD